MSIWSFAGRFRESCLHCVRLWLRLLVVGEAVERLPLRHLVHAQPLAQRGDGAGQLALEVVEVVHLGRERVGQPDGEHLPVRLPVVDHAQQAEHLDGGALAGAHLARAHLHDVERVVVAAALGVTVQVLRVLPRLREKAVVEQHWGKEKRRGEASAWDARGTQTRGLRRAPPAERHALSPHLYSRSTPFFSSCLIGLFASFVATSNFARVHLGTANARREARPEEPRRARSPPQLLRPACGGAFPPRRRTLAAKGERPVQAVRRERYVVPRRDWLARVREVDAVRERSLRSAHISRERLIVRTQQRAARTASPASVSTSLAGSNWAVGEGASTARRCEDG